MGKWHVCWDPEYYPQHQGFDLNIGGNARGGPSTFFDPYNIYALPDRKKGEYLPYRLADEAMSFIETTPRDVPFFLFFSSLVLIATRKIFPRRR